MKKKTTEQITLITAIIGALTGVIALGWQIADSWADRLEKVAISSVPMLLLVPKERLVFSVLITNLSRDEIYISGVSLELSKDPKASRGEVFFMEVVDPGIRDFKRADFSQPLKPKQSKHVMLIPFEYQEDSLAEKLSTGHCRLVVHTSIGNWFSYDDFGDSARNAVVGYEKFKSTTIRLEKVESNQPVETTPVGASR